MKHNIERIIIDRTKIFDNVYIINMYRVFNQIRHDTTRV
jgi:hypothetical protein